MAAMVPPAGAGEIIDELRLGAAAHDLANTSEDGFQVTAEAMFASPQFLRRAGSPRPFLYGSFNTSGGTNVGAAGLAWSRGLLPRTTFEGGFGLAYHDGPLDAVIGETDPETVVRLKGTRALLGSRTLFRAVLGMDVDVTETWRLGVYYEHYSHGQILGDGRNQGLDEAGVRVGYRFR